MQDADYRDRCWEWPGRTQGQGYGALYAAGAEHLAHRLLFQIARGPIPEGLVVMHTCDNRLCINPAHLETGSHLDNIRDMDAKGRRARGQRHGRTHLNDDKVREIRSRFAEGGTSRVKLALEFGVSATSIADIINRDTWQHVA